MATTLKNGTATVTVRNGVLVLSFMRETNFTYGEQRFGNHSAGQAAALEFCRKNGLRLVAA